MKHSFQRNLPMALLLAAPFSISSIAIAHSDHAAHNAKHATAKSPSWISVQARTDKSRYAVGEPVKVTIKATNIHKRDAYLKYSSGQRFELKLFNAGTLLANTGEPIYTWSANKRFVTMVSHVKLKPGQSETYKGEIGSEMGELAPGMYRLEAQLSNSSQLSAPPVYFTIAADVAAAPAPNATLGATTDKSVYNVGEAVKVDFSLQNNADAPATFDFNSGQTYDVFVRNVAGETVWNWAANKRFIMATRQVTVKANEKQDFSVEWDGSALPGYETKPGKYTIEAVYTSNPAVSAAPVEIEIR